VKKLIIYLRASSTINQSESEKFVFYFFLLNLGAPPSTGHSKFTPLPMQVWTMSLYQKLKYSAAQLRKLAKEREAIWPPPISFSLMSKYSPLKDASDKDDKKDAARYVKFEMPLTNADPNSNKYERKSQDFRRRNAV
jgi:hypothetical protein